MPARTSVQTRFNEDMIRRNDLPRDVFELIHDLAYDHEGRERFQYRRRAQDILISEGANVKSKGKVKSGDSRGVKRSFASPKTSSWQDPEELCDADN